MHYLIIGYILVGFFYLFYQLYKLKELAKVTPKSDTKIWIIEIKLIIKNNLTWTWKNAIYISIFQLFNELHSILLI